MALVEHPPPTPGGPAGASPYGSVTYYGRRRKAPYIVGGAVVLLLLVVAGGVMVIARSKATLRPGRTALATISLPTGGGTIQSVSAVTGPHAAPVPVKLIGHQIFPRGTLKTNQPIEVDAVVKRPGWISWASGSTEHLRLSLRTPAAHLKAQYLTIKGRAPLRVAFNHPVAAVSYGKPGAMKRHVLPRPSSVATLPRPAAAGSMWVSEVPRTWETAPASMVSWFPAGAATASAVANPAPGTAIKSNTPLTLTFSKPVSKALGKSMPPVSPTTAGTWHSLNAHTIVFQPRGYGYGLGTKVTVGLPSDVRLVGGTASGSSVAGSWNVPAGSTLRLQQLLAGLGYLPLKFHYTSPRPALTPAAQEAAAITPPKGTFSWKYANTPAALRGFWKPGASGTMTRGAIMAFENDHGMTPDGDAGSQVWRALLAAGVASKRSTFGYTWVSVSESVPETLTLWHNGKNVLSNIPVNTGIPAAPTALGTYPVFEHISSGTMSGTNPDGSHYSDPGIPWISYFNGGDALHGFLRASYGVPQSLGCVEMTYADAGKVWPYTPIGTLVHVQA